MVFSYYPGCTLKNKAQELDKNARAAAQALGVTLEELPDWQCCGGAYPMARDEIATKLSSVRALRLAQENGGTLVTLCSACHNVIKQVNNDMRQDEYISSRVNNYLGEATPYNGQTEVVHYLEMLRDKIGYDEIAKKIVSPLKGKKIAAYYGCLLLRPNKVMRMDNPENPAIMESLIRVMGAEPVIYAMRNECCGGYVTLEDKSLAQKRSSMILDDAKAHGADMIITACPLCLYNLRKNGTEDSLPVYYFTEILAAALGVSGEGC